MGLMDFITGLLYDRQVATAKSRKGNDASAASASMNRLKVILASDRAGLDEQTMNKIRSEIQEVIAKYVTIDTADVQFNMQSDDRLTLVTATFPLRGALASGSRAVMREEPPVPVAVAALSSLDDSEEDDTSA